jgi:hypothetical protein
MAATHQKLTLVRAHVESARAHLPSYRIALSPVRKFQFDQGPCGIVRIELVTGVVWADGLDRVQVITARSGCCGLEAREVKK